MESLGSNVLSQLSGKCKGNFDAELTGYTDLMSQCVHPIKGASFLFADLEGWHVLAQSFIHCIYQRITKIPTSTPTKIQTVADMSSDEAVGGPWEIISTLGLYIGLPSPTGTNDKNQHHATTSKSRGCVVFESLKRLCF